MKAVDFIIQEKHIRLKIEYAHQDEVELPYTEPSSVQELTACINIAPHLILVSVTFCISRVN